MKHTKETVESVEKLLNKLKIDYKRHDNIVKLTTKIIPRVDGTGHLRRYSYDYYIGTGQWRSIYSDGTYNETYYKSNGIEDFLTRFFKEDIKHDDMKHIKHCKKCNTDKPLSEYQKYIKNGINIGQSYCRDCRNSSNTWSAKTNPTANPQRMYVNGKYVSTSHPLHKPGRFKTFEGAAFSALKGYEKTPEGYVYIIANPSFDGWLKVGMAIDAEDRCNGYQTSSPHRDYKLLYARKFNDRRTAETKTIHKLKKVVKEHNGEWFKTDRNTAQEIIEGLSITL